MRNADKEKEEPWFPDSLESDEGGCDSRLGLAQESVGTLLMRYAGMDDDQAFKVSHKLFEPIKETLALAKKKPRVFRRQFLEDKKST